jgi:peptidoglycan hydrolase-like protein with peptidoglycan-binding domain
MAKKPRKTSVKKAATIDEAIHDDIQNGKIEAAMASSKKPAVKPKPKAKPISRALAKGMQGDDVKKMQRAIGVTEDGDFGFGTLVALKKWQNVNGLVPDGIVGPVTKSKMGL